MNAHQVYVLTVMGGFVGVWAWGFALFLFLGRNVEGFRRRFSSRG